MPHLSKLAKEYKGKVTFIGLSDESVEKVGGFLAQPSKVAEGKTWGEAMAFAVATDPDLSVKKEIFSAAGQRGIPSTFIISGGKIQWIGHPMSMDKPLAQIVAGDYDIEKAQKAHAEKIAAQKMMGELQKLIAEANTSGNWDAALKFLDEGIAKYPTNANLEMTKWNILLLYAHRDEEAYTLGNKMIEKMWDDSMALNQIAWTVVDDKNVKTRDLKFALKVAERANELTESKNGAIIDTLARVHYESGGLEKAVAWQRKAVENAEGDMKDQLLEVLKKYEAELGGKGR